jgi:putative addiction module component (TIGR02574 family)
MARNFRELRAKMSRESQARSKALADQYRASGEVPQQVSEILEKALVLSSYERGGLIDLLIYTLDIEPNEPAEEGLEAAWQEQIGRRIEDVRSGRVKTIPGEQVLARLRERQRDATAADTARWFTKLDESPRKVKGSRHRQLWYPPFRKEREKDGAPGMGWGVQISTGKMYQMSRGTTWAAMKAMSALV